MMTSSNGNIFRVTGPLCGEFTGPGEFPTQRPVTRSFDVFFDLRLNKLLSKQWWGWWFETLSWSLWRQCNCNFAHCHYRGPVKWKFDDFFQANQNNLLNKQLSCRWFWDALKPIQHHCNANIPYPPTLLRHKQVEFDGIVGDDPFKITTEILKYRITSEGNSIVEASSTLGYHRYVATTLSKTNSDLRPRYRVLSKHCSVQPTFSGVCGRLRADRCSEPVMQQGYE